MKRSALILWLTCFYSFSAQAFDYGKFISCNKMNPRPVVTFKTSFGQLIHDFSLNTDQINSKFERGELLKEKKLKAAGIAQSGITHYVYVSKYKTYKISKTVACLAATEVEVFVGAKNPEIYVTNEYPKDSCNFAVTLRHEQTHQRINYLTLRYFLPLIDQEVRQASFSVRAVKIPSTSQSDKEKGLKQLNEHYQARIQPIIDVFLEARKQQQKKLDNMFNYTMESNLCREYDRKHSKPKQ